MTAMLFPPGVLFHDPLAQADQQIAEAEERRERQIRFLSDLTEGTDTRAFGEHVLTEIERTIVLGRMHRELVQHLLG